MQGFLDLSLVFACEFKVSWLDWLAGRWDAHFFEKKKKMHKKIKTMNKHNQLETCLLLSKLSLSFGFGWFYWQILDFLCLQVKTFIFLHLCSIVCSNILCAHMTDAMLQNSFIYDECLFTVDFCCSWVRKNNLEVQLTN